MSNFYAEGVDLKVAEKYRVPTRISVARELIAHVSGDHYKQLTAAPETEYDFNLERNVIQKIEEWKRVHEETEHVRQEQLRASDRERRQLIEQQQKQLLNQVSYPSTDDLSSDGEEAPKNGNVPNSGDDSSGKSTVVAEPTATAAAADKQGKEQSVVPPAPSAHRLQSDFSVILQPTVVPESTTSGAVNGVRRPLNNSSGGASQNGASSSSSANVSGSRGHSRNHSDFNYSEWESDNYSPFDRMELKSINDLDILAQVLETTQLNRNASASLSPPPATPLDNKDATPEEPPPSPVEQFPEDHLEDKQRPDTIIEEVKRDPPVVPSTAHHSWIASPHPATTEVPHIPNGSTDTVTNTFPSYQQMLPPQQDYGQPQPHCVAASSGGYYSQPQQSQPSQHPNHHNHQQESHQYHSNIPSFGNHQYHHPMPQYSYHNQSPYTAESYLNQHQQATAAYINGASYNVTKDQGEQSKSSLLKSRSKSVPDIVSELEEEVKASEERRRVRNHSQSGKAKEEYDNDNEDEDEAPKRTEATPAYERLPPQSQELALKISKMGFSVNIVATVIEQLGNDDKKIIEHLIPLSELLDLGFGVSPTSEALLKFNNNRERALDFLIS